MTNFRRILFEKYNIEVTYKEFLLSKFQECKQVLNVSSQYVYYVDKNEKVLFCVEKESNSIMINRYIFGRFMLLFYKQRNKIVVNLFLRTFGFDFYYSNMRDDYQNEYEIYLENKKKFRTFAELNLKTT